jgi:hypothetical protein
LLSSGLSLRLILLANTDDSEESSRLEVFTWYILEYAWLRYTEGGHEIPVEGVETARSEPMGKVEQKGRYNGHIFLPSQVGNGVSHYSVSLA